MKRGWARENLRPSGEVTSIFAVSRDGSAPFVYHRTLEGAMTHAPKEVAWVEMEVETLSGHWVAEWIIDVPPAVIACRLEIREVLLRL